MVSRQPKSIFKSRYYEPLNQNMATQILRERTDARKRITKTVNMQKTVTAHEHATQPKPEALLGKYTKFTPVQHWYEKKMRITRLMTTHTDSLFLQTNLQARCFHVGKHGKLTFYPTGDMEYTPTSTLDDDYFEFTSVDNRDHTVGFRVHVVCEESIWSTISISGPPGSGHNVQHSDTIVDERYGRFSFDEHGYDYTIDINEIPSSGMEERLWKESRLTIGFVSDDHYPVLIKLGDHTSAQDIDGVGGDFRLLGDTMYYMPTAITIGMVVDTLQTTSDIVHILRCSYPPAPSITQHREHEHIMLIATNAVARDECDLIIQEYSGTSWQIKAVCYSHHYTTIRDARVLRVMFRHRTTHLTGPPSDSIYIYDATHDLTDLPTIAS